MADRILATLEEHPKNTVIYLANDESAKRSHGYVSWLVDKLVKMKAQQKGITSLPKIINNYLALNAEDHVFVLDDFVLSGIKIFGYLPQEANQTTSNVTYLAVAKMQEQTDPRLEAVYDNSCSGDGPLNGGLYFSSTICDCDYSFTSESSIESLLNRLNAFPTELIYETRSEWNPDIKSIHFSNPESRPSLLGLLPRIYAQRGFMERLMQFVRK